MLSLSNFSVFISGATGFFGKALGAGLTQKEASVHPVPRDFSLISPPINNRKKKVFIHLAGLAHTGQCEENPYQAFEANVSHTVRALLFCQKQEVDFFVFPSTGSVYGDQRDQPATEDDPVYPLSIYAATKLAAETLIKSYSKRFGIRCLIVRIGNVYGAGCHPDSVIGTVFKQMADGGPVILRDLTPVRDFIYKEDVVQGLIRLLQTADTHSEPVVNLSTGEGTTIQRLAETMCRLSSIPPERIQTFQTAKGKASRIVLDNTLLRKLTHWQTQYKLEKGLREMLKA